MKRERWYKHQLVSMLGNINRWLGNHTGYRVAKVERRGFPHHVVTDPRLVAYYNKSQEYTFFAPTELGLGFSAFALGPGSYHPWIVAVRSAEKGDHGSQVCSILDAYYSLVRPASMADWLDIPGKLSPKLSSLPIHGWSVLPWSTRNPDEAVRAIETAQLKENRIYGLDEGMAAGAKAFGPVSSDKLRVETVRITSLFDSLKKHGLDHKRPDYNLRAAFLLADCHYSWVPMSGMHRVAMAAAVGVTHIPVQVAAVIRRDEVDIWPQVAAGLYDRHTALRVFDRLLERRVPSCAVPWLEWVDSHDLN